MSFDQNMFSELSKIKVDRKRKKTEDKPEYEGSNDQGEDYYDEESYQEGDEESYQDVNVDHVEEDNDLSGLSKFINDSITKDSVDPKKVITETFSENDYAPENENGETRAIIIAGKKTLKSYVDKDGNEQQSKFMDETGNINVVYGEPGKNVVNRKTIEEQRLDMKMEALSGLLTKFKSEEEITEEENDTETIQMDKKLPEKNDMRRIDQIINIKNDLDIKVALVKNTFDKLSKEIEIAAKIPNIGISITSQDYLRSLYNKKSIDDMDVSRIFILQLFLESPEIFPTEDTFEQVQYRNNQIGAKCKSIDLKRLITYISSDSEFNRTVDLVGGITKKESVDFLGIWEVFSFKAKELLKALIIKYLKNDSIDPLNKLNTISIKKDIEFKYRNLESTLNFIESLKSKLKVFPASMKEQIKKTTEQLAESEEKANNLKKDITRIERDITILLMLNLSRQSGGYNINFAKNIPKEEILNQLKEYNFNLESENIQNILNNGLTDQIINEILKNR